MGKLLLFKTLNQRHYMKLIYIHGKTFVVATLENCKSLAQRIFPLLRYKKKNYTGLITLC